jgi:hypothetical protein
MSEAIDQSIIDSIDQNDPMPHEKYLKLIEKSKGKLLVEIPILEQLRGYCGLRSNAELNEFSKLFFLILNNSDKNRDLDEVVAMTNKLHVQFVNFIREKIGFRLLESLKTLDNPHQLVLKNEFFQDLATQAKRYHASTRLLAAINDYLKENHIPDIFPESCYKNYLENDRYSFHQTAPMAEEDEKFFQEVIPKQCDELIKRFHQLDDDYDADDLLILSELDEKITLCMMYGYQQACQITRTNQIPNHFKGSCLPEKWIQSWEWETWKEKYNEDNPKKDGYGPGTIVKYGSI